MSWVGYLNYFLLQFFFIRLARVRQGFNQWFSILYWIIPCTGWNNEYQYPGKRLKYSSMRISKVRELNADELLKEAMHEAIAREDYEEAARLRDLISKK